MSEQILNSPKLRELALQHLEDISHETQTSFYLLGGKRVSKVKHISESTTNKILQLVVL